eukprot:Gb_04641 [translate_table: standard]
MGKTEEGSSPNDEEGRQSIDYSCNASNICTKSVLKWIIAMVIGGNVLIFGILSFPVFGKGNGHGGASVSENPQAQIQASFRLQKPISAINASILKLESAIWDEIRVPYTKVTVISLEPIDATNTTEVVFGVVADPENTSISTVGLSVLKGTFVTLVLGHYNLSLTAGDFGTAYFFEVLKFPGGITVVPEQFSYPLQQNKALFNFSLHNTIVQVDQNLAQLKEQLRIGLHVWWNENLFVQLTNLEGSTVEPPIIVETFIMPVVGKGLTTPRLKQLAQEITPARNLGLNHSLFGKVKQIQLSSSLRYPLSLTPAPSPSYHTIVSQSPALPSHPGPSPSPSPACTKHWHAMPPSQKRHSMPPSHHNSAMAPSCQHCTMPPSHYLHAMPPYHYQVAPSPYHPLVNCHRHHVFSLTRCKRQYVRHAPVSGLNGGAPSPSPLNAKAHKSKPSWHRHRGEAAPTPLVKPPSPPALSPQISHHSKARHWHSHSPLFPLAPPTPSSLGSPLRQVSPAFPSHAPSVTPISSSPPDSRTPVSSPTSLHLTPKVLSHVPPPEKSRTPHAELPERGSPVPAFSHVSSSSSGASPVGLIIGSLVLIGGVLSLLS